MHPASAHGYLHAIPLANKTPLSGAPPPSPSPRTNGAGSQAPSAPPYQIYEELATPEGIRALIQRKEVEVTRLREQRSFQLEKQLAEQRDELLQTQTKLQKLQDDFMYNLRLLDERDRELETYDREYTRLQAEASEKDKTLVETRTALAGYQSEVKQAKLQASEAEAQFRQKTMELREAAETARFGKEEALLRQKEDFDRERRELGRRIGDLEDELDVSRREISSSFGEKMQQMAAEHKARIAEAEEKADRAEKTRLSCMDQLDQAQEKEKKASEEREEAETRCLDLQRKLDSLAFDLKSAEEAQEELQQQRDEEMEELKRVHLRDLEHERLKAEDESAKARTLDSTLIFERDESASRLERHQEAWVTESASLRGRMETAEVRQKRAEEQLEETSSAFRIAKRDLEDKIAQEIAQHEALERAHERHASEKDRTHEANTQELREQLWSKDQELGALRGKVAFMKRALDERREDISTFKAQVVAGNEKSRELNRQLIASQLQAEADIDTKEAATLASSQVLMKQLTEDRDRALKVASVVEERAARAEAESARLQGELRAMMAQKNYVSGDGAVVTPRLHLDLPPTSARSGKAASMLTISDVPSPPTLPTMGMGTTQLLGMTGDALGAHSSDDGMTPRQDLSAALERTQKTPGGDVASLEAQIRSLRASLAQAEGENERLKHSVAFLRSEMEDMKHEGHRPGDLSLKAELSAFDQDVQRANQYIEVLQAQISAEGSATEMDEVHFLRGRVKELLEENRRIRREILRVKSTSLGASIENGHQRSSAWIGGTETPSSDNIPEIQALKNHLESLKAELKRDVDAAQVRSDTVSDSLNSLPDRHDSVAGEVSFLVKGLSSELVEAKGTVTRLESERDRVMEISNSLKAELDKIMLPLAAQAAPAAVGSQSQEPATEVSTVLADVAATAPGAASGAGPSSSGSGGTSGATSKASRTKSPGEDGYTADPDSIRKKIAPVEEQLELAGREAPKTSVPPVTRPPEMSRGTESQRAKLRALSRRKEEKQKVANYNLLKE